MRSLNVISSVQHTCIPQPTNNQQNDKLQQWHGW